MLVKGATGDQLGLLAWHPLISVKSLQLIRNLRVPDLQLMAMTWFNTLRPRWNEQHFADDIFKRIFFNENVWISIKISPKFVPKGPINNIPALVQIMAWCRPGDKPLSEPMLVILLTHICVSRPQWVNAETKWPPFSRWYFQMHFLEWKCINFD